MTTLSIVMPVYDTGRLLLESVRSVLDQTLFAEVGESYWELLIVDDASADPETLAALEEARSLSPSIRILSNVRSKGVAGARNTGIFAARGEWIGFLDSDDLWYPDFLRNQRDALADQPDRPWCAAHFDASEAPNIRRPLSARSPRLYRHIETDYTAGRVSRLRRPVDVLLRCGCIGVMTVRIRKDLIQAHGGFNESLDCAEDYDLWLRLANVEDLYMLPIDAAFYRLRTGSLTRSGKPMYHGEDRMLRRLRRDRAFRDFRSDIDVRLHSVYATFCFHFRRHRMFRPSLHFAWRLIGLTPRHRDGWRQLTATVIRR